MVTVACSTPSPLCVGLERAVEGRGGWRSRRRRRCHPPWPSVWDTAIRPPRTRATIATPRSGTGHRYQVSPCSTALAAAIRTPAELDQPPAAMRSGQRARRGFWSRCARGGGTSAAKRSTNSSGVNVTPAVPSAHRRSRPPRSRPPTVTTPCRAASRRAPRGQRVRGTPNEYHPDLQHLHCCCRPSDPRPQRAPHMRGRNRSVYNPPLTAAPVRVGAWVVTTLWDEV